jgi:hypothetical protein
VTTAAGTRKRAVLALGLLALASVMVMQSVGPNQTAHYASVRAFDHGRPWIHQGETGDDSFVHGHFYARKAPGLALFTFPWYEGLRAVRLDSPSAERTAIWKLNLFGVIVPFVVLLVLMYATVERTFPGYGTATSLLLGAGTLLFPFSTLLFDHVLSTTLGFAAFFLFLLARDRRSGGPWLLAAAGLCAGFAAVVEFPLLIVGVALGAVFLFGRRTLRSVAAYAAGFLAGIAPLLAFNIWAFGSPFVLSYAHALGGNNKSGLYGVQLPGLRAGLTLLLAEKGLFVTAPLTAVALFGLSRLWRIGRRREAVACAVIPALFLLWNAGYYIPFGGSTPGPRFLVPVLPFLALPLAAVLGVWPLLVAGIGVASAALMLLAAVTEPMIGDQAIRVWLHALAHSNFTKTVLTPLGAGHGWLAVAPLAVVFFAALGLGLSTTPAWYVKPRDLVVLACALLSWILVALIASPFLPLEAGAGTTAGELAIVLLVALLGAGLYLAATRSLVSLVPLFPVAVLAVPRMGAHPRWSLLLVAVTLCVATVVWVWGLPPARRVDGTKGSRLPPREAKGLRAR